MFIINIMAANSAISNSHIDKSAIFGKDSTFQGCNIKHTFIIPTGCIIKNSNIDATMDFVDKKTKFEQICTFDQSKNVIMQSGCTCKENSTIKGCIIKSGVIIESNVSFSDNCIFETGVIVPAGLTVDKCSFKTGSTISVGCTLTDCNLETGVIVQATATTPTTINNQAYTVQFTWANSFDKKTYGLNNSIPHGSVLTNCTINNGVNIGNDVTFSTGCQINSGVTLPADCIIKGSTVDANVILSSGIKFEDTCTLSGLTIPENCTISANTIMKECTIASAQTIQSNVVLDNCTINAGSNIPSGCTIKGGTVNDGTTLVNGIIYKDNCNFIGVTIPIGLTISNCTFNNNVIINDECTILKCIVNSVTIGKDVTFGDGTLEKSCIFNNGVTIPATHCIIDNCQLKNGVILPINCTIDKCIIDDIA